MNKKAGLTRARHKRKLSAPEMKVRAWIEANHGALSDVAELCDVSPQYVQRIAYGRSDGPSREMRVERALSAKGWPGRP